MLPFTIDQFFGVFVAYNVAIWPVQIAAYVIAAMALWLIFARRPAAGRVAGGVLALFWLWDGIAYHLLFFSKINSAAYILGAGFILQGLLFFAYGAVSDRLALRFERGWRGVLGLALIVYAALVYEVVGHLSGHGWPRAPLFGVAPCPTVIFTFGMLLLSIRPVPVFLVAIPLVWAGIGSTAAILLGVPEDLGLVVSGLIGAVLTILGLSIRLQGCAFLRPRETDDSAWGPNHRYLRGRGGVLRGGLRRWRARRRGRMRDDGRGARRGARVARCSR